MRSPFSGLSPLASFPSFVPRSLSRAVTLGAVLPVTLVASTAFAQVPPPAVNARSWVLMDATSNQILASGNPDERVEPASLTKLMTAYLVFEALQSKKISMDQIVMPSDAVRRVKNDESRMFIEANKPVSVHDLVYGMIIQSGNDAAIALAELVGGSEAQFVDMMNAEAKRLGMTHTHYADVNGMPSPGHYTSAGDLALLSVRLIRDFPEYYDIFAIKEFTYNKIRQFNRNRLLWIDPSVDGLKTGHTQAAGYCLIASAKRPLPGVPDATNRLVTVMMGEVKEHDRVEDSMKMLNYGYSAYDTVRLYKAGQAVGTPRVYKGLVNTVSVGVKGNEFVTVPKGMGSKVKPEVDLNEPLIAPISAGQQVGTVKVVADGKVLSQIPVVALQPVPQAGVLGRAWDSLMLMFNKKK